MRTPIAFLALIFYSAAATSAEWVKLFESKHISRYADSGSITIDAEGAGYRTALVLTELRHSERDLQKEYPDGTHSYVSLREYDCKRNRSRELASIRYAGNMGDGNLVAAAANVTVWGISNNNPAFEPVRRFVCDR